MSLVRFRSKALGYDNCSYSPAFHEFQKTLKSACNLGKPVIRYEMSERQQFNMREWLSWWSTTLPRSGSRVRVPSRALAMKIAYAAVAQSVERRIGSAEVTGPIPVSSSSKRVEVLISKDFHFFYLLMRKNLSFLASSLHIKSKT